MAGHQEAYHEAIIAKIRPIDPDSIVICGNRHWDQECAEASKDPITSSKNIAYSIHFYAATHKQSLRNNGATGPEERRRALLHGIRHELGIRWRRLRSGGNEDYGGAWLDENNVGCTNWSAAALGETSAAFKPGASPTGPWTDDMLKPSGMLVRDYIMSKAK